MYHVGLLLVIAWILLAPGADISNVPLGQLTLSMIGDKLLSIAKIFGGLWLLYKSFEHDKIWPWRWDRFFVADWLVATSAFALAIWIGLGAKKNEDVTLLVCIVLGIGGYAYLLHKAGLQNVAKEMVLKSATYDKSRFPEGFDDHAAKTCIAIYVDEKFEKTGLPPEGTCYVETGRGWAFEVNFPQPKLFQVVRECLV